MDILTYALAKSYTDKALLGVGTIKGAPCTVKSQTEDDEYVYVTLGWENSLGTPEETVVKIKKGADGAPGEPGPAGDPGPQGVSITKIEKIKTEDLIDTYQISFSDNTTFKYTISNGSTDYLKITNKPSIEGVELIGNKTFEDLNIASADNLSATDENLQNLSNLIGDKTSLPAPTDTVVSNIASVDAKVNAIIDDNEAGLAKTFSSDKITKIFATIEEVNKRIPQYDVLPISTEACNGQVVQFIGTTTEDYIHNYFYECVQVENNYKWVNVAVQNVPTKVSELTNDSNFVTETELNAKGYLTEHQDLSAYATKEEIPTVPSKVSELSNDSNYQTAEQVNSTVTTEIAKIVADAPEDLNTLKEMSDWIAGHENDASAMNSAISDNKTAITALQTGKADKSEIPTTLPANGGNADTVNNHTVKSDVPENAVFTDTVYDDTEVKESIDELNSNLSQLEYGEVAGGKNLAKVDTLEIKKADTFITDYDLPIGTYTISFDANTNGAVDFYSKESTAIPTVACGFNSTNRAKKTFIVNAPTKLCSYSTTTAIISNIQIEEGTIATPYEPYIPSVKMLAEENAQQSNSIVDMKMLGWTVPSECPIQNYADSDGVFHQIVGRVDLGSLDWYYTSNRFYTVLEGGKRTANYNGVDAYCDKYNNAKDKDYSTFDNKEFSIGSNFASNSTCAIVIRNDSYTNESAFKNAMQGVYLYYELATPITKTIDGNEVVEQIKNNLDNLEFGEVAGSKNLWNIEEKTYTNSITDAENHSFQAYLKLNGKLATQKKIMENGRHELRFNILNKGLNNLTLIHSGVHTDILFVSSDFNCDTGDYVLSFNVDGWDASVIGGIRFNNIQLEKGTTATDYEPYIPSVKMLAEEVSAQNESLSVIGKCKNLLNPTLQTTTQNGVTCTANGDGTYTLNGAASAETYFALGTCSLNIGASYRLCGTPLNSMDIYMYDGWQNNFYDTGNGDTRIATKNITYISIYIPSGAILNNAVFKPMLTSNLNATYDDFVPYTGEGETLTADVAELKNDLETLKLSDVAGGKNILDINKVLEWINKYTNGTYSNDILTISPINNYLFTNPFQFSDVDIDVTLSVESFNSVGGSNARISLLNSNNISVGDIYTDMTSIRAKASRIRIDYSTLPTSITLDKLMLQLGATATDYEPYIPSVKMLAEEVNQQNESLDVIGKCKNLLKPTLQTTTLNGVTCTANGDGTYTLNGTASGLTTFILRDMKLDSSLSYKLTGCPLGGNWDNGYSMYVEKQYWGIDIGKGYEITLTDASNICGVYIRIIKDTVCNNLVFKPMLTTNLNATYDDFVPYTGDGETLTHDVAELKNDLDKLNSLPIGSIIQIEADKDDIETTKQKYGWQYLGTSNIEYESGSANILVTNVYRKNN